MEVQLDRDRGVGYGNSVRCSYSHEFNRLYISQKFPTLSKKFSIQKYLSE